MEEWGAGLQILPLGQLEGSSDLSAGRTAPVLVAGQLQN